MQVKSTQEALYIACEMERGAVQLYERALMLLTGLVREKEPLYIQVASMLADERQHLLQFRELYSGLDIEAERRLTLAAVASSVLFPGGLMGAIREGLIKDEATMLAFAIAAEEKAAATYRAFAKSSDDPQTADMLNAIALEEDKHLRTLREHQLSLNL